jgi:hypothetical protein
MIRKLLTALVIIVSLGTAGSVCVQDFDKGLRAAQSGEFVTALKEWKVLAGQGDASAQCFIAYFNTVVCDEISILLLNRGKTDGTKLRTSHSV